jgi:hypothetical protein
MTKKETSNSKDFLFKSAFFIITLCLSTYFVLWVEKLKPSDLGTYKNMFIKEVVIKKRGDYNINRPVAALSGEEKRYAVIAWNYFANNTDTATGLVPAVDHGKEFTLSDLSAFLMGLTAAYEIGVLDSLEFDARLKKALHSVQKLPLYNHTLPNKKYEVSTLAMLDENNKPSTKGIGWSAMDIGRYYSFVQKILVDYPKYISLVKKAIDHWNVKDMVIGGSVYGIIRDEDGALVKGMEGKLGYEEYCAKGLLLSGFDVTESMAYTDFLKFVEIYDEDIAVDTRILKDKSKDNYIVSDPYILDGLEFGWDANSKELARRVFEVQMKRYEKEKIVTALSEDVLPTAPFYVYNSLYMDGKKWNCLDEKGQDASAYRMISTKAAFGWYALYKDAYGTVLFNAVKDLNSAQKGWYSGKYESNGLPVKTLTSKTNGMVLEALNYRIHGKLVRL